MNLSENQNDVLFLIFIFTLPFLNNIGLLTVIVFFCLPIYLFWSICNNADFKVRKLAIFYSTYAILITLTINFLR